MGLRGSREVLFIKLDSLYVGVFTTGLYYVCIIYSVFIRHFILKLGKPTLKPWVLRKMPASPEQSPALL